MLQGLLNKSWSQHPTKQQRYCHLPPITKTIKFKRTRHAGHYWRCKDEFISHILQMIPSHGRATAGRTNMQQLSADPGYSLKVSTGAMGDRYW